MSRCTKDLQKPGVPYPRTCQDCGLGPCKRYPPIRTTPTPLGDIVTQIETAAEADIVARLVPKDARALLSALKEAQERADAAERAMRGLVEGADEDTAEIASLRAECDALAAEMLERRDEFALYRIAADARCDAFTAALKPLADRAEGYGLRRDERVTIEAGLLFDARDALAQIKAALGETEP